MSTLEQRQTEFAVKHRITYEEYKLLVTSLLYEEVVTCLELLKASKHSSQFRQRMEANIRSWFLYPAGSLKPLSINEFRQAKPKWPVRYSLPT